MPIGRTVRFLLASTLVLALTPSVGLAQARPGEEPPKSSPGAVIIHIRARDGGSLPQGIRDKVRGVPNVGRVEGLLEGRTLDGVRVIGVEPSPVIHLRAGNEVLAAVIIQGRGLEAGDAAEAMVVGKTFAQNNKTALGLSIPAMLTRDHFPPIIVGGQGFAIVGIYATGDPRTDDQVMVLLPTAQKLLKQPGRLSGVYVTATSQAAADQVGRDLRRALGDAADVTPVTRR